MIPLIIAILDAIVAIGSALYVCAKTAAIIYIITTVLLAIFAPGSEKHLTWVLQGLVRGSIQAVKPLVTDLEGGLSDVITTFTKAFQGTGKTLSGQLAHTFDNLSKQSFHGVSDPLTTKGPIAPSQWEDNAALALTNAYGFGLSSAAVTAAFEAIFPEKLNTLNGIGAMLAQMAGFSEVTGAALGPVMSAAIRQPAVYDTNNKLRPMQIQVQGALNLYARGVITPAACEQFLAYAGHPNADITSLMAGAFRPVQPFVLAASLSDGSIDETDIRHALTFAGYRPQDQDLLIAAFKERVLTPYRQAALGASKQAYERGLITETAFKADLNTLGVPADAQSFALMETGYKKLVELADLYRRGLDEAAQYHQEPLTRYVADLEAIGLSQADADAHYSIIAAKVQGKDAQAAQTAANAAARLLLREKTTALMAQYMSGAIPDAGVVAALVALGYVPTTAAVIYSAWQARKQGKLRFVYGLYLKEADALVLRERVAPILEAVKKNQLATLTAVNQIAALGVPGANAAALVNLAAEVAATKAKTAPAASA